MAENPPAQGSSPTSTQNREFWVMIGYAILLGVLGAFVGLVFLGVVKLGSRWFEATNLGWFGGKCSWVAVTAGAGLLVGLLHHLMKLPPTKPPASWMTCIRDVPILRWFLGSSWGRPSP
jgi:hypothetical protein